MRPVGACAAGREWGSFQPAPPFSLQPTTQIRVQAQGKPRDNDSGPQLPRRRDLRHRRWALRGRWLAQRQLHKLVLQVLSVLSDCTPLCGPPLRISVMYGCGIHIYDPLLSATFRPARSLRVCYVFYRAFIPNACREIVDYTFP